MRDNDEPDDESATALIGSGALAVVGVATGGVAGVGFLVETIEVPLWFPMAAVILPTGDVLKVVREQIKQIGKKP